MPANLKLNKLNTWLTLLANLGVLAGIVFLSIEISQSNRIATFTAENTVRAQSIEEANFIANYSGVVAKLREDTPELTPSEFEIAHSYAALKNNSWGNVEAAYNAGLLTDRSFRVRLLDIDRIFDTYPGLLPVFNQLLTDYDFESNPFSIFDRQLELLTKAGLR